jgi:hypothetical protein
MVRCNSVWSPLDELLRGKDEVEDVFRVDVFSGYVVLEFVVDNG